MPGMIRVIRLISMRCVTGSVGPEFRVNPHRTLPRPFGTFSVVGADLTRDGRAEVLVAGGDVAVLIGGDGPVLHRIEVERSPYGLAIHSWLP